MPADEASYLRVEPGGFLGMVPRRNRIAGNARVLMVATFSCRA